QRELSKIQKELRKTILFVTHDIDEALLLGDQIAVLQDGGQIEQVGSPKEIIENPANEFVARFVGVEGGPRELSAVPKPGGGWNVSDSAGRPLGSLGQLPKE
ncbi:MAG: ABC transporter ATP-binding protein, partial [Ancrocorticia sp.]